MENVKWNHMHSAGGKFNEIPTIIGDELTVAVGSDVKIYGSSGLVIAKIETSEKIASIISLEDRQLITLGESGKVAFWDSTKLLKSFDLNVKVVQAVGNRNHKKGIFLLTSADDNYSLCRLNLKTGSLKLFKKFKRLPTCMQLSADGNYLVVGGGRRFDFLSFKDGFSKNSFSTSNHITSVDIHPTENFVAIGDDSGKITFWYIIGNVKPITSTVHWHASGVNCVRFTPDGVYLLSGGHEGVLVIWQLETRMKQFLAHLGSDILSISISADQLSYLLHLRENSLKVISAVDLQIKSVINGIKTTNTNKVYPFSTGIIIDPRSKSAVMNGYPGTVQFYDFMNDSHILDLEVAPRNRISSSDDFEVVLPHITKIAFSQNGNWMATVDRKVDSIFGAEQYLHFWKFDPETQGYVAHTRIEAPHDADITSVDFRYPAEGVLLVVTSSMDKKFKIWELSKPATNEDAESWTCRFSSSYKDLIATCAQFSPDGSILCICFGKITTLWDPLTLTLEKVLCYSISKSNIKHICFSKNSTRLIVASKTHIYVWNLLSCTLEWCLSFKTYRIVAEKGSDRFLALSSQSKVLIFSVASPIPIYYKDYKTDNVCIVDATLTRNGIHSTILLLTSNHQLETIMECPPKESLEKNTKIISSGPSRLFSNIFGENRDTSQPDKEIQSAQQFKRKDISFLSSPSFLTPPPLKLVHNFLESFLLPVSQSKINIQKDAESKEKEEHESIIAKEELSPQPILDKKQLYTPQQLLEKVSLDGMDDLVELFRKSNVEGGIIKAEEKKGKDSRKKTRKSQK